MPQKVPAVKKRDRLKVALQSIIRTAQKNMLILNIPKD